MKGDHHIFVIQLLLGGFVAWMLVLRWVYHGLFVVHFSLLSTRYIRYFKVVLWICFIKHLVSDFGCCVNFVVWASHNPKNRVLHDTRSIRIKITKGIHEI